MNIDELCLDGRSGRRVQWDWSEGFCNQKEIDV
jgi:hypothetical protein